jgi:hypothetical protein
MSSDAKLAVPAKSAKTTEKDAPNRPLIILDQPLALEQEGWSADYSLPTGVGNQEVIE